VGEVCGTIPEPFSFFTHHFHNSLRNQYLFRIEGGPPKFHVTHVPFILGAKVISAYRRLEDRILGEVKSMSRNIIEIRDQSLRSRVIFEGGIEFGISVCLLKEVSVGIRGAESESRIYGFDHINW